MSRFRAVAFDLFDTLVDFDPSRFPEAKVNGGVERTTSRVAYDALYEAGHSLPSYPAFHVIWLEVSREVWEERARDPALREIPSRERFLRLVRRLVAIPPAERERAAALATEAHMAALTAATFFDAARLGMLGRIRSEGMGVGLVSNFDHAPSARRLLQRTGLAPLLDAVVISEEEGFRKPAPSLFLHAAGRLRAAPAEVLFVGDNYEADVLGSRGAGMPCAWLNPKGAPPPDGAGPPDFEIREVMETLAILGLERTPASP